MICKNCGASLPADSKVCIFCGAAIDAEAAAESTAADTQEAPYTAVANAADSASPASAVQNIQETPYSLVADTIAASSATEPDLSLLTEQKDTPENPEKTEKAEKKRKGRKFKKEAQKKNVSGNGNAETTDSSAAPSSTDPVPAPEPSDPAGAEGDIQEDMTDEQAPATEAEQKQADDAAASKGTKPRTVGLIALIEVVVLAAAVFIFFQYRTDTIHSVTAETLSMNSVSVTVDSRNGKDLEVICSTDAGEVERAPVSDSVAVFTDLEANTSYTFEPVSSKGKLLLSNTTATAKTNQQTSLNGIAVTSYSATSATFSISGTGPVPDTWLVTLTADDGTVTSETVSGTEFTFDNLTPQTTYTVTVERGDGEALSGDNTCDFTTQGYTTLSDFVKTGTGGDTISLAWSYSGTIPDSWTISCTDSEGNTTDTDATGTEYTLTGLAPGMYTITLSCSSMEPTDLNTMTTLVPGDSVFTDVTADSYCYEPALWAYYAGISSGTSEGQFSPDQICTRAQVVTFLWRLAGEPAPASTVSPFTDVTDPDSPSYNAIMWAVEAGITSGTTDTTFSPDTQVTRAQVVTFLWRYAGKPDPEAAESSFADVDSSDSMLKPIMWAVESGITSGTTDTTFSPSSGCSRGQVVTFMYRYLGLN